MDMSLEDKLEKLEAALTAAIQPALADGETTGELDVFDTYAVVDINGRKYRLDYSIDEAGNLTVGERQPVEDQPEVEPEVEAEPLDEPVKSNAFKSIAKSDDELRIGNYIVLFGGLDLTGEQFAKNVDLESSYTKSNLLAVDFEHGMDTLDQDEVLGRVDWKTARRDERGVFVERVLNRRSQYVQWLESLIDEGLIGNSSEAVSTGVERVTIDGKRTITRWPLKRDTLTVSPAEPRMLSSNAYQAIKSLEGVMPSLKALVIPEVAICATEQPEHETNQPGDEPMTPEEMALIAKSVAEELRKSEPAVKSAANIEVVTDEADRPFKSLSEFFAAVKNAGINPNQEDRRLRPLKASGMNETSPADGGYLTPNGVKDGIISREYADGEILSRVASDPVAPNSNGMTYHVVDETSRVDGSRFGGIQAYWGGEASTITASKPKFRDLSLKLNKVFALCYATDELISDYAALTSWLSRTVASELRFKIENSIFEGDGVGKPLGIMNSPALVTVTRDTGSRILAADILGMWARRWAGVNDYVWLISQDAFAQLPQMSIANQPVFVPAGGLSGAQYGTLLGRPVIETEHNATLNTTGDIMLASLSQYQTIARGGIDEQTSIHVNFVADETAFRFIQRIGGAPMWNSPLTPAKGSNTRSPFVVLTSAT